MAITVASQATDVGSIPIARSNTFLSRQFHVNAGPDGVSLHKASTVVVTATGHRASIPPP
ncbi:hypothetical protein BURKHO8Y_150051 [Burkholderia sp. 8Y]|nr:hypothetical protein BURKHO8Y_150051 [Burkholderia sp. 8Y]